jgi:hypothetical protein
MIAAVLISVAAASVAAWNRRPWSDEGWFSSASYNLAKHGFLGTTILESAGTGFTRIEQRTYWAMPLYMLGEALWYLLFPTSVFSTRVFTICLMPLALWGFHLFLSRLLPQTFTPALAVCLLALSFVFIDNAGFARPDLMCCTLGIWGLASYLLLRERSLSLALLVANSFIAASGLTHPNGVFHFCSLLPVVIWFDRRRLSLGALGPLAVPYVMFGGAWLLYASRDFSAFLNQIEANGLNNERWTSTLNPAFLVWNEIHDRYLVAFGFTTGGITLAKSVALGIYLVSATGCLFEPRLRSKSSTQLLLVLLGLYFVLMSVFNQKLSYYLIHIVPFYIALAAVWSTWLWNTYPRMRIFVASTLIFLVSIETGGVLLKAHRRSYIAAQRAAVRYTLSNTQPTGKIAGSASLIYEMAFDPRLHDDPYLGIRSGVAPSVIVIDDLYRDLYASWNKKRPADMQTIYARLASYTLAYRNNSYEVYLHQ